MPSKFKVEGSRISGVSVGWKGFLELDLLSCSKVSIERSDNEFVPAPSDNDELNRLTLKTEHRKKAPNLLDGLWFIKGRNESQGHQPGFSLIALQKKTQIHGEGGQGV